MESVLQVRFGSGADRLGDVLGRSRITVRIDPYPTNYKRIASLVTSRQHLVPIRVFPISVCVWMIDASRVPRVAEGPIIAPCARVRIHKGGALLDMSGHSRFASMEFRLRGAACAGSARATGS